jgi:hypothetical protein
MYNIKFLTNIFNILLLKYRECCVGTCKLLSFGFPDNETCRKFMLCMISVNLYVFFDYCCYLRSTVRASQLVRYDVTADMTNIAL